MPSARPDHPTRRRQRSIRFLTHSPPAPGISGDRIRVFYLMRELKRRGWTVRLWSLVHPDEPAGFADALDGVADEVVLVARGAARRQRVLRLARDAVTGQAFQQHWFWSPETGRAAAQWLRASSRDPLFVEQLYMYPFVPTERRPQVVLDTQNHESARIRILAETEGRLLRRLVARLQVNAVTRFERRALNSVGCILAVSDEERRAFERIAPGRVRLVPNGVNVEDIVPVSTPPASRELLFLGSLGYSANRDALRYFMAAIAPLLARSGIRVTVVGSGGGTEVEEIVSRAEVPVTVAGYVQDVAPYFSGSRAMIVPLRHGGGTRLKVLEALAWGLPVITTTIGGAGLDLVSGTNALIADDPPSFAAAVNRLVSDDGLWQRLSQAGRMLVEGRFAWSRIGDAFESAVRETEQ